MFVLFSVVVVLCFVVSCCVIVLGVLFFRPLPVYILCICVVSVLAALCFCLFMRCVVYLFLRGGSFLFVLLIIIYASVCVCCCYSVLLFCCCL